MASRVTMAAAGAVAGAAALCYCFTQSGSKRRKSEAEKQVLTHALLTAEFDHVAEGVDRTQEGTARGGKLSWSAYSQLCERLHGDYQGFRWLGDDMVLRKYLFQTFDADGNQQIDRAEFTTSMLMLCVGSDDEKRDEFFKMLDECMESSNSNGKVDLDELDAFLKKDLKNKIMLAPAWAKTRGEIASADAPILMTAAAAQGNAAAFAIGGLVSYIGLWATTPEPNMERIQAVIKKCAEYKAIEIRQRVAIYAADDGTFNKEQFKEAWDNVLKEFFSLRTIATGLNAWMAESKARLELVVALVDNESSSANVLSEPELSIFVKEMLGEQKTLNDWPEIKAMVGQTPASLRTFLGELSQSDQTDLRKLGEKFEEMIASRLEQ